MTAVPSSDMSGWLHEQLDQASPDLLRGMVRSSAQALMSAEADVVCGAAYGERSDERVNSRNGYRHREWDTRAGSIDLQVPKLRQGSYFPGGCWSGAAGPRPPWSRWSRRATCWACPPGGWRS